MSHRFIYTIRTKLTLTIVCFTFALLIIFAALMFRLFSQEQRNNLMRSTEFNLQLVAGMIDKDLDKLQTLSRWSASSANMTSFLRDKNATRIDALNAYTHLLQEYQINRSTEYIRRLVVYGGEEKLLQVGNATASDTPIILYWMRYNLQAMSKGASEEIFIGQDLISVLSPQVLLILRPILLASDENGLSYMAINTELFTKQFEKYNLNNNDKLYLTVGNQTFSIIGKTLSQVMPVQYVSSKITSVLSSDTLCNNYIDENGKKSIVISYPIKSVEGWYISHSLANDQFSWWNSGYDILLITLSGLIIIMGACMTLYMHRLINKPVAHLRKRIDAIAKGNFERDDTIEWNNELGDIGRGINALSRDVFQLMGNRLKDENEKRVLEYKMLQSQINPHFIYNTLNSIKWMATIQNATGIAEMTTAFSRLLKSVAKGNKELITLREEFALLNDYCVIQQYRYGGSITLEIAEISDEDLCDCLIPRFTLQPLAENAIFHGIEPNGGVGTVLLHINQTDTGDLVIAMQDNGVGMSSDLISKIFNSSVNDENEKFKQIGILNVHRRIQFAFGENYGIQIFSELNKFTRMEITIPCHKKQDKENTHV